MRLFIATKFPAVVLRDLNDRASKLKPRLPPASWVREETQHLTLAFLGEQPEANVDAVTPAFTAALGKIPAFEARLRGCGFFPNARHARVGWIGLQPDANFIVLAETVREVVEANGIKLDSVEFKPHLTLMRIRDPWPPASIELYMKSLREYESAPFTVDSVTLFSSQLSPKGAIHTPRQVYPLRRK
ncbi:MAG TPA: RNA 2',3'-cyclic phosphodiesterase [Thermoanaerobaculia bacterium]|jgi:2'-5' RNA ligase|nr:RNA 2',3'-cyclic phosphodiesterase [Thermoanaerobaculia bacterium]